MASTDIAEYHAPVEEDDGHETRDAEIEIVSGSFRARLIEACEPRLLAEQIHHLKLGDYSDGERFARGDTIAYWLARRYLRQSGVSDPGEYLENLGLSAPNVSNRD